MPILIETHDRLTEIVIDLPEKRNALGPDDAADLADTIERAGGPHLSALVLRGNGAFCAGGDLKAFAAVSATSTPAEIESHVYGKVQRVVRALRACPCPTIAAVDGPAVGLGMDLALACDMRFLGPRGFLLQGWARAGLIAGTGGVALHQRLSPASMWRLIATQEKVDATAAEALGLGERGEPDARSAAATRAEELGRLPDAVRAAYCELSRSDRWPTDQHFELSARYQAGFIGSERFREFASSILASS